MSKSVVKLICEILDNNKGGWLLPEWLLGVIMIGSISVAVVSGLLPDIKEVYGVVVERITSITGSGF